MSGRVTYACGDTPVHVYRTDAGAWRVDHGLSVYLYADEKSAQARAMRILNEEDDKRRGKQRAEEAELDAWIKRKKQETLPPEVLANALQDRIHPTSGKLISATAVKVKP